MTRMPSPGMGRGTRRAVALGAAAVLVTAGSACVRERAPEPTPGGWCWRTTEHTAGPHSAGPHTAAVRAIPADPGVESRRTEVTLQLR